jgi:hypothetical protein
MARIPISNGGQVQMARAPVRQIRPEGMATARALEGLGATGVQIGVDQMAAQTRLDRTEMLRQQEVAEAATRARDSTMLHTAEDGLRELSDSINARVLSGEVPKDQAETLWQAESKKRVDDTLPQFSEGARLALQPRLMGMAGTLGRTVRQAVEKKARDDISADLVTGLEQLQRQYSTDPDRAEASMHALLDTIGPFSNYSATDRAKLRQGWKEQAQYTMGYEAVSRGRQDPAALADAEKLLGTLSDLDPQKRAVLTDRIAGYRLHMEQQAELRAQRAARAAEATMRQAQAEFETFQGLADKGTVLRPEYVDRAIAATAGTPYQAGIRALAEQARENGGLAAQPLAVQQATLDAIDVEIATRGRSPELDRRRQQVARVAEGSAGDVQKDPLRAAVERGVVESLPPLALNGGLEGLAQGLQQRVAAAERVTVWAGRPVSPLTSDEAQGVARMMATLPPDQKGNAIAVLAQTMPPAQMVATARLMDAQDKPLALAMAAGSARTTEGRTVSELILRGAQAVRDKSVKEEAGAEYGTRALIAAEVANAVPEAARADIIESARLIFLGKQAAGERVSERGAVALALGGPIVEHNGRRLPVPAGLDEDSLREKLRTMPASRIDAPGGQVMAGGQMLTVQQFLATLPDAQLEPVGLGRYAVRAGGALVTNAERRPVVVDLR